MYYFIEHTESENQGTQFIIYDINDMINLKTTQIMMNMTESNDDECRTIIDNITEKDIIDDYYLGKFGNNLSFIKLPDVIQKQDIIIVIFGNSIDGYDWKILRKTWKKLYYCDLQEWIDFFFDTDEDNDSDNIEQAIILSSTNVYDKIKFSPYIFISLINKGVVNKILKIAPFD